MRARALADAGEAGMQRAVSFADVPVLASYSSMSSLPSSQVVCSFRRPPETIAVVLPPSRNFCADIAACLSPYRHKPDTHERAHTHTNTHAHVYCLGRFAPRLARTYTHPLQARSGCGTPRRRPRSTAADLRGPPRLCLQGVRRPAALSLLPCSRAATGPPQRALGGAWPRRRRTRVAAVVGARPRGTGAPAGTRRSRSSQSAMLRRRRRAASVGSGKTFAASARAPRARARRARAHWAGDPHRAGTAGGRYLAGWRAC